MARFTHHRLEGSLWTRGPFGIACGAVLMVVLLMRYPGFRFFFGVSVIIGLVIALGLRWYYQQVPIKDPNEGKVVLHLNDEEPPHSTPENHPPAGPK